MRKLDLEKGQEVVIRNRYHTLIRKVIKVTEKGYIRLETGELFDMYGSEKRKTDKYNYTNKFHIYKSDEQGVEEVRKQFYIDFLLREFKKDANQVITFDQAQEIARILNIESYEQYKEKNNGK